MSGALASAGSALSFLAFDFGTRRVGVAAGNSITRTATPLQTVSSEGELRMAEIGRLVEAWRPTALVVGVPFHPDGAAHANTQRARRFARELQARFALPVHEVDERYSTTEAKAAVRGDRRRQPAAGLDAVAAAVILDQHLAALA